MSNQKKNFYQELEIKKTASEDEIKQAYRRLAKIYHPDMNPENETKFHSILEGKKKKKNLIIKINKGNITPF